MGSAIAEYDRRPRFSYLYPQSLLHRLLVAAVLIGCVLLFVREPGPEQHRLWRLIWDFGHILLFAGIGYLCAGRWLRRDAWMRGIGLLLAAVVVGWLIECLQAMVGRDYSLQDVAGDTLGMALGLLIGGQKRLASARAWFACGIVAVAVGLGLRIHPVARAAVDAIAAAAAFPELANFSTGFAPDLQLERFSGSGDMQVVDGALRISLHPARYAGFFLDDFPNDWRGRRWLQVELENPGSPQSLTCRIHDAQHERNNALRDRYNRVFPLTSGTNRLRIDLDAVAHAPERRSMDMGDIRGFGCFIVDLEHPQTLLLRSIALD